MSKLVRRITASPLGRRLARGTIWAAAGTVASRVSLLVTTIIVSRALGRSGLGEFGVIQNTIAMFQVAAGLGMGIVATKYVAEHRVSDPRRAGHVIGLSLLVAGSSSVLMSAALFIIAPWLATSVLAAPSLVTELRISGGILVATSIFAAAAGALSGFEAFRSVAVANLASGVLAIPIVYAGVRWAGLTGAVWGLFASSLASMGIMLFALRIVSHRSAVPVRVTRAIEGWRVVWDFGLPTTLSWLVVSPVNWACAALLVNRPGGYEEMGVFSAANQWRVAIVYIPIVVGQVLMPVLSERIGARDDDAVRKLVRSGMMALGLICAVPVVGVVALSPFIMRLYGPGFEGTHPVLIVLALSALITAVLYPIGSVIAATGRMWIGFAINLGWGIAAFVLTWFAVGRGAMGLALAQLGAYTVHALQMYITALDGTPPLDHVLWFEGTTYGSGNGEWMLHDVARTGDPAVLHVNWDVDGSWSHVLTFENIDETSQDLGDTITYTDSRRDASIVYQDVSAGDTWEIEWDKITGTGSLQVPDYHHGERACWDEHREDVVCPA